MSEANASAKKATPVLVRGRFQSREQENNLWVATVEQGVQEQDILEPAFWSHVSAQLRPYDRIEVRWDDGIAYAELLVLACDRAYAKVYLLRMEKLTTVDVSMSQLRSHEVRWRGPKLKWSVVRLSDSQVLKEEIESRENADMWLRDYLNVTKVPI